MSGFLNFLKMTGVLKQLESTGQIHVPKTIGLKLIKKLQKFVFFWVFTPK